MEDTHQEDVESSTAQDSQTDGNIRIVTFALPSDNQRIETGRGIVGNIIFFGTSAYVWASWGRVHRITHTDDFQQESHEKSPDISGKGLPLMGSLGLAMPRKRYAGMQSEIPSYTQLIGGVYDDDMILGTGMACRLSSKFGFPIFVSLNVAGSDDTQQLSTDESISTLDTGKEENIRMTVARIEKEATRILLENRLS